MATKLVEYEHVAGAAQLMISEGKRPTAVGIRNILNVGSLTTITKELRKWEIEWDKKRSLDALPIPAEIDEQASEFARKIYVAAKANIEQLYKDRDDSLALDRAQIDEDIKEAFAKIESTKEKQEALAGQVLELERDKADLLKDLATLTEKNSQLSGQLADAVLELKSAQKTIEDYRDQRETASKDLAITQEKLSSKIEENEANCLKLATLDSELRDTSIKNIELVEQLRTEKARSTALEMRVQSLEAKAQQDDGEIKNLISEKSNLAGQVKEKAEQVNSLSSRLDNAMSIIEKFKSLPAQPEPEQTEQT